MANSLKFGTSGLRGLAVELEGQAARRYVAAFLRHVASLGQGSGQVFLGRDFRSSSPRIVADCAAAVEAAGLTAVDCGALPTPALALHAMAAGGSAVMVTGSHIPDDRNGLKFYVPAGEISKADEQGIVAALDDAVVPDGKAAPRDEVHAATERYFARCAALLPAGALQGLRIGVFEHSTVARDLLVRVLGHYGADVVPLGRTDRFVAVDTEAFGDDVFAPLQGWIERERLHLIVSADGDGDRPLIMDGDGQFVRGDVIGLLAAQFLRATTVVTPVTSNSAIERLGVFSQVVRTKVGSPFVVAAMETAAGAVVGFEANGGTFVGNGVSGVGALPTRDAVLPVLCVLGLAQREGKSVAQLVGSLPLLHAVADRLQHVPSEKSAAFLGRLEREDGFARSFFGEHGVREMSAIDGLKFTTTDGDSVHFRASGNAPELRCYVEASSPQKARDLLNWAMEAAAQQVG